MESAAKAGCASARTVAPASQNAVFMVSPCLLLIGDVFFANSKANGKHDLRLPSSLRPILQKMMHHNSHPLRLARIIIQVLTHCDFMSNARA
jgi:hypothetical protein